ncbi:MAG: hypothetical protein V2I34_11930 [Bacteroidales bacterium]|jgi:hypothetical protein|nr:hypothetical protein [Bacteroidales bacterium]
MKRKPPRNIFFLILTVMFMNTAVAQVQDRQSTTDLLSVYFDKVYGDDQRLISGHLYKGAASGSIQGHPYYLNDEWKDGVIETADGTFPGLKIKYDININRVIIEYISTDNAFRQVGLNPGKILYMNIGGKDFIPLPGTDHQDDLLLAEIMSKGQVLYLVTKSKALYLSSLTGSSDYEYRESLKQYLLYEDELIPFRNKRTLYKLFPDKKKLLRKYSNRNYLNTSGKRTGDRIMLLDYLNTLLDPAYD